MFTILVVIDTPTKVSPYGGSVAAPIFQKIASGLIRHRGIAPSINPAPPVLIARRDQARERPVSGPAEAPRVVALAANQGSAAIVPDLTGMSAREAVTTMVRLGLSPRVLGDGMVVNQRPLLMPAAEDSAVSASTPPPTDRSRR